MQGRRWALVAGLAVLGVTGSASSAAQGELSAAEERYLGAAATLGSMMGSSFERVAALTDEPRINDLEWQNDFLGETSVWRAIYIEAQELDPSDRLSGVHEASLEAYATYDEAAVQARAAIEALDPVALGVAAQTVSEGNAELQEAADLVAAFNES